MQDFWKNVAALIKVKTIVTLIVVTVFAVLALRGGLQPDTVMTIVTMVIAFYFGTQSEGEKQWEISKRQAAQMWAACRFFLR